MSKSALAKACDDCCDPKFEEFAKTNFDRVCKECGVEAPKEGVEGSGVGAGGFLAMLLKFAPVLIKLLEEFKTKATEDVG